MRTDTSHTPRTLYDKIWDAHVVAHKTGYPAVLYVDLHIAHEALFPKGIAQVRELGRGVRRPELACVIADHWVPSDHSLRFGDLEKMPPEVPGAIKAAAELGIALIGPNHEDQGIVHVVGPALGLTQPGMTVVCTDSHTSTHGALGALAFGIGTTQQAHVFDTQTILQHKERSMRVTLSGALPRGVAAKDVALHLLAAFGTDFGQGHVIEFAGDGVRRMSMDQRMTLCNMGIEMGARSSLVAPDESTVAYLRGARACPDGLAFDEAAAFWLSLNSDDDAQFDRELAVDLSDLAPYITYGTNPGMAIPVDGRVPHLVDEIPGLEGALAYMDFQKGDQPLGKPVNRVFIGSCTNSRISDLREAADVLRGRRVPSGLRLLVVPGSQTDKRTAEREGLDTIVREAGGVWGEPGCSMCVGVNGDTADPGEYVVSTSNRNFPNRQGAGVRTILASPATAAACAVTGRISDPRDFLLNSEYEQR